MKKVICAFPGIGTGSFVESFKDGSVVRVKPKDYRFNSDGTENDEFPNNYIDKIKDLLSNDCVEIVVTSASDRNRKLLAESNVKYINVYPYNSLRLQYLKDFRKKKASKTFLTFLNANWHQWLKNMAKDDNAIAKLRLNKGVTLSNILK